MAGIYARNESAKRNKPKKALVNGNIPFRRVLLINEENVKMGEMDLYEAINYAKSVSLDVFCVSATTNPPVCKVLDYGKHKYQESKNLKEQKKNQQNVKIKEIRLTPTISINDLQTKARHANDFLNEGNRVKISLKFRGRENSKRDLGVQTLNRFVELVKESGSQDQLPVANGKFLDIMLVPKKPTK